MSRLLILLESVIYE